MKTIISTGLFALAIQISPVRAADQIVTLGDSLTFAYESEFCFSQTINGISGPTTIGDGMPQTVRNWIEILSNPVYRGDKFELGSRDSVTVTFPFNTPFSLYFRQSNNWAIPGLKVDGMRQFIAGEASFLDLLDSDPDFSDLDQIIAYSDFNDATDFALTDFENQIQNTAERVVIAIGGNDVKGVYGTIYNSGSSGTFVADFVSDVAAVIDRVQALKPGIQIVLVNVPHVGITLKVRQDFPYDAMKTERVSAVLRNLNGQLAVLAANRGIGYADIYTPTVPLINPATNLCVYGYTFSNLSAPAGSQNRVWLGGDLSDNFHPNTNGQAVIANEIIDAFNRRYQTGIAPLSATEIGTLGERSAIQINMSFATWSANYGLAGQTAPNDADGDGVPAGVEFATGLNPARHDSWKISSRVVGGQFELSYPVRLPTTVNYTLAVQSSSTLANPFAPVVPPVAGTDGLVRATIPVNARGFLRLKADIP